MLKERRFTLNGLTSFLLIVCWMMAIHLIRASDAKPSSVASSAESETSLALSSIGNGEISDQQLDEGQHEPRVDELLNAVEHLVIGRLDDDDDDDSPPAPARHEHQRQQPAKPDSWSVVAKREEAPVSSAGVNRIGHAIGLHPRSALNKNFIRFGRSGAYRLSRAQALEKLRRALLDQADLDNEDSLAGFPRSSRGLQSNFIRFGRSVPSSPSAA